MDEMTNNSDDTAHSDEENVRTNEEQHLLLYNKAIKWELFISSVMTTLIDEKAAGQLDEALKHFTKCLEGVDAANTFTKLPHCLREIAAIYYDREDYEKAVQFAQAEKLYYEAALISSTSTTSSRNPPHNNNSTNDQYIQKANEYEQLASLCLKQHKIHLALEYCGKVAKLRQLTLGPSNPATVRSLDMFTVLYAEAGRQQYADALRLTRDSVKDDSKVSEEPDHQKNHVENCDESEESKASKADVNDDTVDNRTAHDDTINKTIQYSSIVYTKRTLLFFFLVSSVFAVMLSLWIMR